MVSGMGAPLPRVTEEMHEAVEASARATRRAGSTGSATDPPSPLAPPPHGMLMLPGQPESPLAAVAMRMRAGASTSSAAVSTGPLSSRSDEPGTSRAPAPPAATSTAPSGLEVRLRGGSPAAIGIPRTPTLPGTARSVSDAMAMTSRSTSSVGGGPLSVSSGAGGPSTTGMMRVGSRTFLALQGSRDFGTALRASSGSTNNLMRVASASSLFPAAGAASPASSDGGGAAAAIAAAAAAAVVPAALAAALPGDHPAVILEEDEDAVEQADSLPVGLLPHAAYLTTTTTPSPVNQGAGATPPGGTAARMPSLSPTTSTAGRGGGGGGRGGGGRRSSLPLLPAAAIATTTGTRNQRRLSYSPPPHSDDDSSVAARSSSAMESFGAAAPHAPTPLTGAPPSAATLAAPVGSAAAAAAATAATTVITTTAAAATAGVAAATVATSPKLTASTSGGAFTGLAGGSSATLADDATPYYINPNAVAAVAAATPDAAAAEYMRSRMEAVQRLRVGSSRHVLGTSGRLLGSSGPVVVDGGGGDATLVPGTARAGGGAGGGGAAAGAAAHAAVGGALRAVLADSHTPRLSARAASHNSLLGAADRSVGGGSASVSGTTPGMVRKTASSASLLGGTGSILTGVSPVDEDGAMSIVERLLLVTNWEFDVFEFAARCDNRPLAYISFELFARFRLFDTLGIQEPTFNALVNRVERDYCYNPWAPNPYHTNVHAADVVQAVGHFLMVPRVAHCLDRYNAFSIIVAAMIHDFRHPGVNNMFLIKTSDPIALRYNDDSVLENFHSAEAFAIMAHARYNILAVLSSEQRSACRFTIIKSVLATDLAQGQKYVNAFKAKMGVSDVGESDEDKLQVLQMMIKCADVSHPARTWKVHERWSHLITEEFYRQGDRERELGLPLSPLCDRHAHNLPKSQIGFVNFVVLGSFQCFSEYCRITTWMETLRANEARWKALSAAGSTTSTMPAIKDSGGGGGGGGGGSAPAPAPASAPAPAAGSGGGGGSRTEPIGVASPTAPPAVLVLSATVSVTDTATAASGTGSRAPTGPTPTPVNSVLGRSTSGVSGKSDFSPAKVVVGEDSGAFLPGSVAAAAVNGKHH